MRMRLSLPYAAIVSCLTLATPLGALAQVATQEDSKKSFMAQTERAGVISDRGAQVYYTNKFDLSGLPEYRPEKQLTGWVRLHGNNYLIDGKLGEYWKAEFAKHQPGINLSFYLPTAAVAFAALYYGQADVVMGHHPGFYDLLAYQRVMGFDPVEITAVTGSYDVPGWESSTVIMVNDKNPIKGMTMAELDGVFGAERDGGWSGTNFRPDWARGADKNIRKWGALGLKGSLASQRINPYGFNLRYNTATDFADRVMQGGDKWNENFRGFAHIVKPDGKRYIQAEQIADAVAGDRQAIAYTRFRGPREGVRQLPIAARAGEPYVEHTIENVQNRTYPLYNEAFFYTTVKPGTQMDPLVKEFLRFVVSRQGQAEVMRDGKYLPLTEAVVREQMQKLE
ncbi:PstS family phosphate ABC transporter substrate-binding protein [Steroidobacter sp.]|uniref:PstS family phosphate ABC transporter substrate-binding protein n=1 Tax=Steroidobacter sp. TaxID=1978227 RepID=UPI001A4202DE|nr:substrate-binding domain-containing protein [Steroidobacter sp.]MBL8268298.1 hypothetical protein [Steroidobacter sp.]